MRKSCLKPGVAVVLFIAIAASYVYPNLIPLDFLQKWSFLIFFTIFCFYIGWYIYSLEQELGKLKKARPKVNLKSADVKLREWTDTKNNVVTGKPYFALIEIANEPITRTENSTDKVAWAEITYYDDNLVRLRDPVRGRWSSRAQPDMLLPHTPLNCLDVVELNANGIPQELAIAIKYPEDKDFYCFNNDSYKYPVDARNPDLILTQGDIKVYVLIKGEKIDGSDFWFSLHNSGQNKGMEIKPIPPPKQTN